MANLRSMTALFLAIFLCAPLVGGKDKDENVKDNELQKVKYLKKNALPGDKQCGPYFIKTNFGGRRENSIFYFHGGKLSLTSLRRVVLKISEKKRAPTVQSLLIQGPNDKSVCVGVLIQISSADYEKAKSCFVIN